MSSKEEKEEKKEGKKSKDEEGVYVHKDGKANFVPVTVGLAGESNIEITKGLTGSEEIVTGPFRALRELKDGTKVRKEEKKEEKEGEKK